MNLPSVSVIIPTYNSDRVLNLCLQSIQEQDYPKPKMEIIVVDGGSRDNTVDIACSSDARIIRCPEYQQNQEARRAVGLFQARNELLAYIDSDNILPHKNWLKKMVQPLLDDDNIIATQTLRYTYNREHSFLNRYFALFGVTDPVSYYFNKRDRLSWAEDSWNLLGEAKDLGDYYLVRYTPKDIPTLGCNGYLVRREVLLKSKCDPEDFFHIDVNADLIRQGYNTYAVIKDDIIHFTSHNLFSFLSKRFHYVKRYQWQNRARRRYSIYTPKDRGRLIKYILISLTIVKPLTDSIRGFKKIPDLAWFLHPVICLSFLFLYGFLVLTMPLSTRRRGL